MKIPPEDLCSIKLKLSTSSTWQPQSPKKKINSLEFCIPCLPNGKSRKKKNLRSNLKVKDSQQKEPNNLL